jgi:hypothetical protein
MDPCTEQGGVGNGRAIEVGLTPEAIEFVRFCYRRRRVGWPELYDEMSAVAARGLFQGWSYVELGEHGIGFCLDELPRLAALAERIAREERRAAEELEAEAREPGQEALPRRPVRRLQAVAALG